MRVVLCVLLLGVVTMLPARALAGPPATADKATLDLARQYVDAGVAAQNAGDYDTAITLYSKAYQLVQHPVLIFDLAQAHRLAGHVDQALTLYRRYLAEDPRGANAKNARELITELEARKAEGTRPAGPRADDARRDAGKPSAAKDAERARPAAPRTDDARRDAGKASAKEAEHAAQAPHAAPEDAAEAAGGVLVVRATGPDGARLTGGTVTVDDQRKGELEHGKLTVTALAEGRHTVAIEAGSYQRFTGTVTMHGDEPTTLEAQLVEAAPSRARLWRISLIASAAFTASAGGFTVYSYAQMKHNGEQVRVVATDASSTGVVVGTDDCQRSVEELQTRKHVMLLNPSSFTRACTWHGREVVGLVFTGVGATAAVASLILMMREPGPAEPSSKPHELAIAPIAMPGGGGAALSVTW